MKDDLFDEEDSNKYVPEDLNLDLEDDDFKIKNSQNETKKENENFSPNHEDEEYNDFENQGYNLDLQDNQDDNIIAQILNSSRKSDKKDENKNNENDPSTKQNDDIKTNLIGYVEGNSISTIKTNKTPKNNKILIEKEIVKKSLSKVEIAEANYYVLKTELEKLLEKDEFDSIEEISNQNEEMINYLSKLSSTLSTLVDNSTKEKNDKINNKNAQKEKQENKIIEVYKREYLRLENRLKQLTSPLYKEGLKRELQNLDNEIQKKESQNKKLKAYQRQSELLIEKQSKNLGREQFELKRLKMDLNNINSQKILVMEKIKKNNNIIQENYARITQLNEWQQKLEKIAKEMYDIQEYENIQLEEQKEGEIEKIKENLMKKIEIYEKVMKSNKNKYESEISRNEKTIFNLEQRKLELIQNYRAVIGEEAFQKLLNDNREIFTQNLNSDENLINDNNDNIEVNNINEKKYQQNNKQLNISFGSTENKNKNYIKLESNGQKNAENELNNPKNNEVEKNESEKNENQTQMNDEEKNKKNDVPLFLKDFIEKEEENKENEITENLNNNNEEKKEKKDQISIYTQLNNIPQKKSFDEFEDLEEMKI
jgi:hypothetical protein